jgi:hypothetical protein
MDDLIANIPLDSKRYNRTQIGWIASGGAGHSLKLDPAIVHDRLVEMAAACIAAAEWVEPQIPTPNDEEITLK